MKIEKSLLESRIPDKKQNMKKKSLSDLQSLISDEDKKKIADDKEKRDRQMKEAREKIINLSWKEMNVMCFPAFIRLNYPDLRNESNDLLIALGKEFKAYLEDVFKGKLKEREKVWDIELGSVAWRKISDPFSINGYDPVFVFHFSEFCEKMKKKALKELGKS